MSEMPGNTDATSFVFNVMGLGKQNNDSETLLRQLGNLTKLSFGVESVRINAIKSRSDLLYASEEVAVNTKQPYIDNSLSSYSAFPELINLSKEGYHSYAVFPIMADAKPIATLIVLSKIEGKFNTALINAIAAASRFVGYQIASRGEAEKSASLAKYFDAAFNTAYPQFLVERQGKIIMANKAALNLFGSGSRDIVGKTIDKFFSADVAKLMKLTNGQIAEVSSLHTKKYFNASTNLVNENVFQVSFYDLTQEKELANIEEMLKSGTYELYLSVDSNSNILWSSGNGANIFKSRNIDLSGRKLSDFVQDWSSLAEKAVAEGSVSVGSLKFDFGNEMHTNIGMSVKHTPTGFACKISNIDLKEYAKKALANMEFLLDASSDIMLITDSLGYIKRANRSVETFLGFKSPEILGTSISNLYADEESGRRVASSMNASKHEGKATSIFINMVCKKADEQIPCVQTIRQFTDKDGDEGYIFIAKSLATEQKLEELQLQYSNTLKKLTDSKSESDLKTQFLYNISHDLKTPITNIKGFSHILQSEEFGEISKDQKEYLGIIYDEADRLMLLIQQILEVAKLSSGKIKLDLQETDFSALGENPSITALAEVASNKSLSFKWKVNYDVPKVMADPNRIIQIFVNLISNAIKFTDHGGITVNIFKKGKSVRAEVIDTGVGISKEDQRKLFKKFFQVQRKGLVMQHGAGTGLGLSIAKGIVSLHDGRMKVVSEQGKGSTFWFTIPIHPKKKKSKEK